MTGRVVILTAGMGAGHDQVALELRRRLLARNVACDVLDVWELLPFGIGRLISGFYKAVVRHIPWLYEAIYAIWLRPSEHPGRRASPIIGLAARRLERWMAEHEPTAAVSTFHLCSQVLGHMRRRNLMPIPTASIVVDFATHGLWVDADVDIHFCLHPAQAERVRALGAPCAQALGPVVKPAFCRPLLSRAAARHRLGIDEGKPAVLIVAGSWGAGHIERTVRAVAADGRFCPLVVTGNNEALHRRLAAQGTGRVYGWVEDMSELMLAADAMVENAGGLMAMEAMALGTPVVSFEPIPGHGRENVARMDEVGVSRYARSERELLAILDRVVADEPYRHRLTLTASRMFRSDVAEAIESMAGRPRQASDTTVEGCASA